MFLREYEEPATAVAIQGRLGLSGQMAFDVSNACMGFIDAWCIADSMIASRRIRKALLVAADKMSVLSENAVKIVNSGGDVYDQFSSFTMGDGAAAAIVGPRSSGRRGINLKAGLRESFGQYSDLCIIKSYAEGIMRTQTKPLWEAGSTKFAAVDEAVLDHLKWSKDSLDFCVPHQVSVNAIKKHSELFGIPFEKNIMTFQGYGNMASVSIPFTLSMGMNKLKQWKNQRVLCTAYASGLGLGAFGLEMYGQ